MIPRTPASIPFRSKPSIWVKVSGPRAAVPSQSAVSLRCSCFSKSTASWIISAVLQAGPNSRAAALCTPIPTFTNGWKPPPGRSLRMKRPMPPRAQLKGDIDSLIGHIVAAQEPTGYLNTYYVGDKAHLRFTELTRSHEDYCLGHLLQAGIAYYRATGNRRLLDVGIRFADYVVDNFGPTKRPFVTGHPELEMALVELYRTTRQTKYLDFARYLFSGVEHDRLKLKDSDIHYMFSGKPFTSRTEFEGHAVRALYAASGATDYFTETGDPAYKKTLDLLWTDLTMRKMYITGGVGSRSGGESFGDPYELPSEQAYAETCAAIANVMWNYRLLALTGDARYADLLERALYNGVNSGLSLSGNLYCYRNPLASSGDKLRNPWYDTTCCPPNIQRLFESLPAYLYSTSRDGVYVNLYQLRNWIGTWTTARR